MTHPTNPDGEVNVTDEKWDAERLDAAIQDFATVVIMAQKAEHGGMRKELKQTRERIHEIARLLSATQPAAVDREAVNDAQCDLACEEWANSFVNIRDEPVVLSQSRQYDFKQGFDAARKLLATPLDKDASKPAVAVGVVAHDPVERGYHMQALIPWDDIPVGAKLYLHSAAPSVDQDERKVVAPVTVSRTHPNQAYVTLGFGSENECSDFLRCLNDLYTRKRPRAASTSANVAAATEWLPTAENINALPEPIRAYIAALETNCDPAGMVRENAILRHDNAEFESRLANVSTSANVAQGAEAVAYRYRHSENEKWHYGPTPQNWWECQALYAVPPAQPTLTDAARDVLSERQRQVTAEGWTPAHDDEHEIGELARAAACYAANATGYRLQSRINIWPWDREWWKPSTPRRDLIKAGALILAEIERLDRRALTAAQSASGDKS